MMTFLGCMFFRFEAHYITAAWTVLSVPIRDDLTTDLDRGVLTSEIQLETETLELIRNTMALL